MLVILLVLYFFSIAISSGPYDTWAFLGVSPTSWSVTNEPIPFGDMYHVLSCGECNQLKYNVYQKNPCDPWERLFMYPRIWLLLTEFGLNRNHSALLGAGLALVFFISFFVFVRRLNYIEALLYATILCSPAVMLGVERANADVLIFIILACSLAFMNLKAGSAAGSYGLIFLGAILKLYPIAAFLLPLREKRRKAIIVILFLTGSFLIYFCLSFPDMVLLKNALPHDTFLSYGGSILFQKLGKALNLSAYAIPVEKIYICFSVVLIPLVLTYSFLNRKRVDVSNQDHIDSFRVGALIYAATFLIATNYNYRLVFLIFTVPQILSWIKNGRSLGFLSSFALASIIITLWFNTWRFQFVVREIASWFLLVYFLCLLLLTLPEWILNPITSRFREALHTATPLYRPLLVVFLIVFGLFIFEILRAAREPNLPVVYPPNSSLKTVYPHNPRGYFQEDPTTKTWWLRVVGMNQAELKLILDFPDLIRVNINKATTQNPFDIQLNLSRLKVTVNRRYEIQFRARAEKRRKVFVAFARSHEPWTDLGLYEQINLRTDWQTFTKEFTATDSDENARILFDMGGSDISVEVSSVQLRSISDNKLIEPDLPPTNYFVDYHFNALGCRDRDYQIPKPDRTQRILFLGDSFTAGTGVHDRDTFANQLERLLNQRADRPSSSENYEVINCGIGGYELTDQRLFFQIFGQKYQPDLVFTVLNRPPEHILWAYANPPTEQFQKLLYAWAMPAQPSTESLGEIEKLNDLVHTRGARLILVLAGENPALSKDFLKTEARSIPVLTLDQSFYKKYSEKGLEVYPKIDHHPNEIAHFAIAQEIMNFLQQEDFFNQRPK